MRNALMLLLSLLAILAPTHPAVASDALPRPAVAPLPGPVVREFDAPEPDWLPGHRGVDLAGAPGAAVVAAAAGTVTHAGVLVDRGVVVVEHGGVRTTYEPVDATVAVGMRVSAGDVLGRLAAGHPGCPAVACLHWGLRRGERYLDPRLLLQGPRVRLVPTHAPRVHSPLWRRRGRRAVGDRAGPRGPAVLPRGGRAAQALGWA